MSIWDSIKSAWQSIISTKMRSVLTVLGVVIGVAAVVFLVGLGRGQQSSMITMFEDMGANAFYVSSTSDKEGSGESLTLDDAEALEGIETEALPVETDHINSSRYEYLGAFLGLRAVDAAYRYVSSMLLEDLEPLAHEQPE